MISILVRYGASFVAGVFAMWLWHNASINRIEKNEAKQETVQAQATTKAVITDAKDAGTNSENYLEQISRKNTEIAGLRQQLDNGSVKLRVCSAEQRTAGLQADNSRAAENEARSDIAGYREDAIRLAERGKEVDAWMTSCHQWVNR